MKFTTSSFLFLSASASLLCQVSAQIPSFLTGHFTDNEGSQELEVIYGRNKLVDGEKLSVADVENIPTFKLCDSCAIDSGAKYIIMLLDVDAHEDEDEQVLHYLRTDFVLGDGGTDLSSQEPALLPYLPPNPPEGTGPHRYVWLLFHRPATVRTITGVPDEDDRLEFDVVEWFTENGLGEPDWGVHFVAEFGGETESPVPSEIPTPTRSRQTTTPTSVSGGSPTTIFPTDPTVSPTGDSSPSPSPETPAGDDNDDDNTPNAPNNGGNAEDGAMGVKVTMGVVVGAAVFGMSAIFSLW